MTYSKNDFSKLHAALRKALFDSNNEPIFCQLHSYPNAKGAIVVQDEEGEALDLHVAEACNIASVVCSIERILSLPRSNIACQDLSEVLLLRLGVLREYIRASFDAEFNASYQETPADKIIRQWAGFLKHPGDYVFAHRCLVSWDIIREDDKVGIDTNYLTAWDGLSGKEKDKKKDELRNKISNIVLPPNHDVVSFFESCRSHLENLVICYSRANELK